MPVLVANRRGVVVDQPFRAVFRNEDVTIRRAGGAILAQHERCWILDWRAVFVHCAEDIAEQFPPCVTLGPAQERFRHAIHRRNAAAQVGCDNGVADARECRSQQLAVSMCLVPGFVRGASQSDDDRAGDCVSQRPDERRGVREPEGPARRDKEVVARQISHDGGGDALGVPAYPHRGRNGAVQRDQRQVVAQPRVEKPPNGYRKSNESKRQERGDESGHRPGGRGVRAG